MKSRRGSTLVLVALMLTALMGVAAIAADIGRFYVVTGELQTSADAAALKGAAVLQRLSANYASTVDDSVTLWARATNRSDGDSVVIAAAAIDVGWWDPDLRTFSTLVPAGQRPNAVSVKANGSPRGVFAQLIGQTAGLPLERRAIAWIANISSSCTRPWQMQYLPLVTRVNGNSDTTKDLDMGRFITYAGSSPANRTMVMRNSEITNGNPPSVDGVWTAYNLPSNNNGNGNAGATTYQSQIAGCSNIAINSNAVNGVVQPSTGNGNCQMGTVVCWAIDAAQGNTNGPPNPNAPGFCRTFTAGDATCYDRITGTAGATIDLTFGNITGNGAQGADFKYVAQATFLCFFARPGDVCSALQSPRPQSGYTVGTMVVMTQGLKSPILNPSQDVLSNAPSNRQRFILVQ